MTARLIHRPIEVWPGELTPWNQRQTSPFRAAYSQTLHVLGRELFALQVQTATLQMALREQDLRNDGLPRSTARPAHPGVILGFNSAHGPLQYATDTFTTWQDNLRAIALGLEALRKVERYGISHRGEQYTGFRALPPGEVPLTIHTAAELLARYGDVDLDDLLIEQDSGSTREYARKAYRNAARKLHPDAGGEHQLWVQMEKAARLLMAS